MVDTSYQAWVVEKEQDQYSGQVKTLNTADLPEGEVLVQVRYSSLNYKDALSATGNPGVTRHYPHTPGIDAAGIVAESLDDRFTPGEKVIVTSYDLGMNTAGGYGQYIRVPADWVVKLPETLSLKESMILGTAGFTAGMSVFRVVKTISPDQGDILVTGATGGVGCLSVGILAGLGYKVTALSGKKETALLEQLGAVAVIPREAVLENADRPLLKPKWAGVIDTVGGPILAAAIKATQEEGVVTCCGLVASPDLPLNVFPFILRGVSLFGIDSQHCAMAHRQQVWEKLGGPWKTFDLDALSQEVTLEGLEEKIQLILKGKISGRTLVSLV